MCTSMRMMIIIRISSSSSSSSLVNSLETRLGGSAGRGPVTRVRVPREKRERGWGTRPPRGRAGRWEGGSGASGQPRRRRSQPASAGPPWVGVPTTR
eukprot:scaffold7253_cov385-Prasinococcus_capsulatus_cf.AAC.6